MDIKEDLKYFYNQEAEKYYYTRNKHWSEGDIMLKEIKKNKKKNISILEFGCGSGRLIKFLNKNLKEKNIEYIGIDISSELLKFAKKDNKKNKFICEDISKYIKSVKQESFDFIIGIASFQHIPSKKERLFLIKNFYKSLKYNGKLIMTNRSFSNRFIKKQKKSIIDSILKSIYTLGKHKRRDLQIKRKNKGKEYKRYYHIFTKNELKTLLKIGGFKINIIDYTNKKGQIIKKRNSSQNTITIGEKNIYKK
ncbi:MAG TPA: class I SAM-dependent methyltransferase [Candidatus Absconditabacterales bacterium]|nr:class I SAM-dependent methyltransferase [Candidatus Absconditabacterales bacterium]